MDGPIGGNYIVLSLRQLAKLYPRWSEFTEAREAPNFTNSYLEFWAIDTHLDFDVANSSDQRTYSQLNILDAKIVRFLLSLDQQLL